MPAEKQQKVNEALDRGVAWLKKAIMQGSGLGGWPVGIRSLAGLTLLECGVPADDPDVQQLASLVRRAIPKNERVYELSLAILFLDRLGEAQDRHLIQHMALELIAGQTIHGGWEYTVPLLTAAQARELTAALNNVQPKTDKELAALLADNPPENKPLDGMAGQPGSWVRPNSVVIQRVPAINPQLIRQPYPGTDASDNSNTQFALLALWAARRHGVPVDPALALIVHRFYREQCVDGGWTYHHSGNAAGDSSDTMTCAGLLGVGIGHALSHPADQLTATKNERVDRGLARLGDALKTAAERKTGLGRNLYFIWSVERVGVLFNIKTISGVDWYSWAVDRLVSTQTPDGYWLLEGYAGSAKLIDTCFALLVLRRADLAKDLSRKLEMLIEVKELK